VFLTEVVKNDTLSSHLCRKNAYFGCIHKQMIFLVDIVIAIFCDVREFMDRIIPLV